LIKAGLHFRETMLVLSFEIRLLNLIAALRQQTAQTAVQNCDERSPAKNSRRIVSPDSRLYFCKLIPEFLPVFSRS